MLATYNFEYHLEQGFAAALAAHAGLTIRTSDDPTQPANQGELQGEIITLTIETGAPASNEHSNTAAELDHYLGTLAILIQTPRLDPAPAPAAQAPTGAPPDRHNTLLAKIRETLSSTTGTTALWQQFQPPTAPINLIKLLPTTTEREVDAEYRTTILNYSLAFHVKPAPPA